MISEYGPTIAQTVAAAAIFAISPPPLPLFPPQGLPQPGSLSGGGGALPSIAIGVRTEININQNVMIIRTSFF